MTDPPDGAIGSRVARAGVKGMVGQVAALAAALVATPVVIRLLGPDSYGLLSLIQALIGYLGFADLGMGYASSRFGVSALASGDDEGEAAVVWTSVLIAAGPSLGFALLLAAGAGTLAHGVLHLPPHLVGPGRLALRIAALGFVARSIQGVVNTSLLIRLRWGTYTLINTGTNVMQILMTPLVLALGGGVVAATVVIATWAWLSMLGIFVASALVQPCLWRPRLRRTLFRPLLKLGGAIVVGALCTPILADLDRVLLAHLASIRVVAYYSVAASVAALVLLVPNTVFQPVFAGLSLLLASGRRDEAGDLLGRTIRLIVLIAIPTFIVLIAIGRPAISAWAGPVYGRQSSVPMYILLAGIAAQVIATMASQLLTAGHKASVTAIVLSAQIPVYMVGLVVAIHFWGIVGCALAWTTRSVLSAVVLTALAHRVAPLRIGRIRRVITRFGACTIVGLGPLAVALLLRASSAEVVAVGAGALAAYAGLVWVSVLVEEERAWVRRRMQTRSLTDPATRP